MVISCSLDYIIKHECKGRFINFVCSMTKSIVCNSCQKWLSIPTSLQATAIKFELLSKSVTFVLSNEIYYLMYSAYYSNHF